jgi:hypothetical protein
VGRRKKCCGVKWSTAQTEETRGLVGTAMPAVIGIIAASAASNVKGSSSSADCACSEYRRTQRGVEQEQFAPPELPAGRSETDFGGQWEQ